MKVERYKPAPGALFPGLALVPFYPGAEILNVYYTGGLSDPGKWIRGELAGARSFDSLALAVDAAASEGRVIVRRADHYLALPRDVDAPQAPPKGPRRVIPLRQYRGVTIERQDTRGGFTGGRMPWIGGGYAADTLADLKAMIREGGAR